MANLFMRFPGGRKKALTLSYDDGVEQDIRLIEIMNKHGLRGTFNLNSGEYRKPDMAYEKGFVRRRLNKDQVTELYANSGQEVACHGLTHPFLEELPSNICIKEVIEDRRNLEEQFGRIIRGMAYPFGTYNDTVVEALKLCGIAYCRTVISTGDFRIPQDWLRLAATCHHSDSRLKELTEKFVCEEPRRHSWLFYLWGHSYEFEEHNNWNIIEEFAERAGGHEDIWYATNIEIYDYVQAFKALIFSSDMTIVHNPSATDVYFEYKEQNYVIKAGEQKLM